MIDVSIVIVCMNNVKQLFPCLDSIKKYTSVSYETFVVAYLFSKENLELLRSQYPWVTIIESNEIRGFSENNNLALRQARGKYCFILNDDTLIESPVVDDLAKTFTAIADDNVAVVSPKVVRSDGSVQCCGRPPITWKTFLLHRFHLWRESSQTQYVNKSGIFKSYNIIGAAFMIKTSVFEDIGWFDEQYFFCPEDISVSTKLNDLGYSCYVNSDICLIHLEGMSGKSASPTAAATLPAARKGECIFLSKNNKFIYFILALTSALSALVSWIPYYLKGLFLHRPNRYSVFAQGDINILRTIFSKKSPKEIFSDIYRHNLSSKGNI